MAKDRQRTRLARGRTQTHHRPAGYEYLDVGASTHGSEPAQKTSAKVTVPLLRKASQHGHHPGTCHHARRAGAAHWPGVHGPAGASNPGAPWAAAGPHRRAIVSRFLACLSLKADHPGDVVAGDCGADSTRAGTNRYSKSVRNSGAGRDAWPDGDPRADGAPREVGVQAWARRECPQCAASPKLTPRTVGGEG